MEEHSITLSSVAAKAILDALETGRTYLGLSGVDDHVWAQTNAFKRRCDEIDAAITSLRRALGPK